MVCCWRPQSASLAVTHGPRHALEGMRLAWCQVPALSTCVHRMLQFRRDVGQTIWLKCRIPTFIAPASPDLRPAIVPRLWASRFGPWGFFDAIDPKKDHGGTSEECIDSTASSRHHDSKNHTITSPTSSGQRPNYNPVPS